MHIECIQQDTARFCTLMVMDTRGEMILRELPTRLRLSLAPLPVINMERKVHTTKAQSETNSVSGHLMRSVMLQCLFNRNCQLHQQFYARDTIRFTEYL